MDEQDNDRAKREGHALLLADVVEFIGMAVSVIVIVAIGWTMFTILDDYWEWAFAATLGMSWVPVALVLASARRVRADILDPASRVRARHARGDR